MRVAVIITTAHPRLVTAQQSSIRYIDAHVALWCSTAAVVGVTGGFAVVLSGFANGRCSSMRANGLWCNSDTEEYTYGIYAPTNAQ